jgi:large subunit ribosomal protein L24
MSLGIKKGDKVVILAGKDKAKTGKVLEVFGADSTIIVEGLNLVIKHLRKRTQTDQGGRKQVPRPLPMAKVALVCPNCAKGVRFGIKKEGDTKARICRKCGQSI